MDGLREFRYTDVLEFRFSGYSEHYRRALAEESMRDMFENHLKSARLGAVVPRAQWRVECVKSELRGGAIVNTYQIQVPVCDWPVSGRWSPECVPLAPGSIH